VKTKKPEQSSLDAASEMSRARRLRNLIEQKAQKEGKTVEQLLMEMSDPSYKTPIVDTLKQYAFRRGFSSIKEMLKDLTSRPSKYPGPDCLQPHEIEDAQLPRERILHLLRCKSCGGLYMALYGVTRF
jgi:hypothetical protein